MTPEILEELRERGLLPDEAAGASPLPRESRIPEGIRRGKYRGTLIGGAIGDALGRPGEGQAPWKIRERYGELTDFHPWHGWTSGPRGTITDDTQMSICVAETLVAHGRLDAEDLAQRFVEWLPHGRGRGRTCVAAILRLRAGTPWYVAGRPSAGNGAAMRAAPVGLLHAASFDDLRRDAALSSVVTHADPMAVASAICIAFATAYLLRVPAGGLDVDLFIDALVAVLGDVHDPGHPERKEGSDDRPVTLRDRIAEIPDLLGHAPEEAFAYLHNGAFVLESLPAAIWSFLSNPEDPERALIVAANGGYDADTVASMAGNLAGAYHGAAAFPRRWREDLEFADELRGLADALFDLGELHLAQLDR
ncbi:MAG: ADP-ribosylglycohydrolase family protein [Gemmatimonadota bacterium]